MIEICENNQFIKKTGSTCRH